jgi:hypothetical protein
MRVGTSNSDDVVSGPHLTVRSVVVSRDPRADSSPGGFSRTARSRSGSELNWTSNRSPVDSILASTPLTVSVRSVSTDSGALARSS